MSGVSENVVFGDYRLGRLISEDGFTKAYLAEQISVGRQTLLTQLKTDGESERERFLADVRAKAAVEHPAVGSIYEAFTEGDLCYYTEERLPGLSLRERVSLGEKLKPADFVRILSRAADVNLYFEAKQCATAPFGLRSIFIDDHGVIRVSNLAISGERTEEQSSRDILKLGRGLENALDASAPGGKRCQILLAWMRGEEVEQALGWSDVQNYCEQIEHQLDDDPYAGSPQRNSGSSKKIGLMIVASIVALAVLIFLLAQLGGDERKPVAIKPRETSWVTIQEGLYTTPAGLRFRTNTFEISTTEVTIGEYAEFLDALERLDEEDRKIYDHRAQPADKTGHQAADWKELYAAAREGREWKDYEVTLDSPIVGVDWWDAYSFAKWKRGFVPTLDQWMAALHSETEKPEAIPASDWVPVSEISLDTNGLGILGLSGSVSEWTSEPRTNPSNPLGESFWVIAGGSYQLPGEGANSRVFVTDRSLRRDDIGFRICRELQP